MFRQIPVPLMKQKMLMLTSSGADMVMEQLYVSMLLHV